MKKSLLLAIIICCCSFAFAQAPLIVQSNGHGLYVEHKVSPKENFYSIGRLYNISPKDIAAFNSLDMAKGLTIGEIVKIPLNASNFSQSIEKGKPIYYVVQPKEGLYKVSLKNNNVLMANLRKWNKLSSDKIEPGQKLIVGFFLPTKEADNLVQVVKEPEIKQPVEEVKKEEPKKEVVVEKKQPVEEKKEVVTRTEEKKMDVTPVKQVSDRAVTTDGNGGYFKSQFDLQEKTQSSNADLTASAGIFKTASGWQDAKYYALMDHVEPGTIIKIINPTNNKAIYAKVLGEMSGIRQNQGYDVRISNAAASALDITDTDKFIVRVNY